MTNDCREQCGTRYEFACHPFAGCSSIFSTINVPPTRVRNKFDDCLVCFLIYYFPVLQKTC